MCCSQNTPLQIVTVQLFMYFCVHNINVTHKVLLSEHTVTDLYSIIGYVR